MDLSTVVVRDVSFNTHSALKEPRGVAPRGVVMHTTIGRNSLSWLQGGSYHAGTPASCDKLFAKDGTVYLLTGDGGQAEMSYHAGRSTWRGQYTLEGKTGYKVQTLNRIYLGYEVENLDNDVDPFTPAQMLSVAASYAYDAARWRIKDVNLTSHARCAMPYGRKSDPLHMDFGWFWQLVWDIRREWPPEWEAANVHKWLGR